MKILIANDHAAIDLKKRLTDWLRQNGHEVEDLGVAEGEKADYPDVAANAVAEYGKGGYDFGILLCGTGIGISIAANRRKGIRCALVHDVYTATMAREHNDANFIALGGRVNYAEAPEKILEAFMSASFGGGRHIQRVAKLDAL